VTKKLTWEVDKASLVLKVIDTNKETTWKIRKSAGSGQLISIFSEILNSLWESGSPPWDEGSVGAAVVGNISLEETFPTPDWYQAVQADTEEASRAAQAARVAQLNIGAKWFDVDDDETYGIPIPDYDTGEVRPR
jgi:hypothetical protein